MKLKIKKAGTPTEKLQVDESEQECVRSDAAVV